MGLCVGGKNRVKIRSKIWLGHSKESKKWARSLLNKFHIKNHAWIYYNTVTATQRKSTAINTWSSKRTWKCSPPAELTGLQAALLLLLSLHQNRSKPTPFLSSAPLTVQLIFTASNPLKIQLTPLLSSKSPPYSSSCFRCLPQLTLSSLLSLHFSSSVLALSRKPFSSVLSHSYSSPMV